MNQEQITSPEFLANKHVGIMLAKWFLYIVLLLLFFLLGSGVGSWPIGHYQSDIFQWHERKVTTDFSCLLNWKFIVFYGVSVLPLCVISMKLAEKLQNKLSGMTYLIYHPSLVQGDKCFSIINMFCFSIGILCGFVGAIFSIPMSNI